MVHVVIYITASQSEVHGPVPVGTLLTVHNERNIEIESKCVDRHLHLPGAPAKKKFTDHTLNSSDD